MVRVEEQGSDGIWRESRTHNDVPVIARSGLTMFYDVS
jgi:hypothetical protein